MSKRKWIEVGDGVSIPGYYMLVRDPQRGDCIRGAIANILGVPSKNLPNYWDYLDWRDEIKTRGDIPKVLNSIYKDYGFKVELTSNPKGLKVGVSQNKRNKDAHALVCYNGKVVWCPAWGAKPRWSRKHIAYYLDVIKL